MNSGDEKRILIVDDQELILKALTLILEPFYTIMSAPDGQQALLAARAEPPPNLILLDVKMPDMDGYEVCRRLKADDYTKDIPVIFVTAMDRKRDEVFGFEVGAVDYIAKPIVQETLLARVGMHLALQEKQRLIESRNAELDEMTLLNAKFIALVTHDLRNPIASIGGYTDVLLSEQQSDTEGSGQYLGIISAACNKMIDLINDALDVSIIDSSELDLDRGTGSLSDLVTERVQILEPIAKLKNIELVTQYDNVGSAWFDPDRIAQVLDKLIGNAIKFSPQDGQVSVSLEEVDTTVMISVKDQGPGIPEDDQSGIFDRFRKLWDKSADEQPGAGLGLAIARKIVDVHQGTMVVESESDKGTTFTFTLPKEQIQT